MKVLILIFAICSLWSFSANADGLPYLRNGNIIGEAIILQMNDAQFKEVNTCRTVVLTSSQRALMSRLFKTVPERLTVVSSSFNDNREDAKNSEVHCIWSRGRNLAITYDADYAKRQPEHYWNHAFFTSVADPDRLLLSSDAKIYKDGKELSVENVYKKIDALAARAAKEKPGFYIDLRFSLPPRLNLSGDPPEGCLKLLDAFEVYGKGKGVAVGETW